MAVARVLFSLLMAAQLAVAGLIIGLVAAKMSNMRFNFDAQNLSAKITDDCLMGTTSNGVNLCYVSYGVGGVSILATGALSLLQCCTCNLCGLGFLFDTVFALAGTGWWAAAGLLFKYWSQQPTVATLPQPETRGWVIILSWVGCGLFAAAFLINFYRIVARCCKCCGHGDGGRDVERGRGNWGGPKAQIYTPASGPPAGYRKGQFIAY